MAPNSLSITVTIVDVRTSKSQKPYAVGQSGGKGGHFCIWATNGENEVANSVAALEKGKRYNITDVCIASNGGVYLYDTSTIKPVTK